jgi:hypothetical protein
MRVCEKIPRPDFGQKRGVIALSRSPMTRFQRPPQGWATPTQEPLCPAGDCFTNPSVLEPGSESVQARRVAATGREPSDPLRPALSRAAV